jgi:hypothetical protein
VGGRASARVIPREGSAAPPVQGMVDAAGPAQRLSRPDFGGEEPAEPGAAAPVGTEISAATDVVITALIAAVASIIGGGGVGVPGPGGVGLHGRGLAGICPIAIIPILTMTTIRIIGSTRRLKSPPEADMPQAEVVIRSTPGDTVRAVRSLP